MPNREYEQGRRDDGAMQPQRGRDERELGSQSSGGMDRGWREQQGGYRDDERFAGGNADDVRFGRGPYGREGGFDRFGGRDDVRPHGFGGMDRGLGGGGYGPRDDRFGGGFEGQHQGGQGYGFRAGGREVGFESRGYGEGRSGQPDPQRRLGRAPRGYQRSDERIKEDICDRLMQSWIDAENVELHVSMGEVVLQGSVDDRPAKRAIEDLVEQVLGVKDVQNQIRVQRAGSQPSMGSLGASSQSSSSSSSPSPSPSPSSGGGSARKPTA